MGCVQHHGHVWLRLSNSTDKNRETQPIILFHATIKINSTSILITYDTKQQIMSTVCLFLSINWTWVNILFTILYSWEQGIRLLQWGCPNGYWEYGFSREGAYILHGGWYSFGNIVSKTTHALWLFQTTVCTGLNFEHAF